MKHLFSIIFLTLSFTNCQKRSTPVITERTAALPKKTSSPYAPEGTVVPDTLAGKTVFTNRCGRCHGLPDVKSYTIASWENILLSMLPRAGVNKENAVHVRAYVLANAGK